MASMTTTATVAVLACTTAGLLVAGQRLQAQGGDRNAIAAALFAGLDGNKDGALSRDEAQAGAAQWFTAWKPADADALSSESVIFGLSRVLPASGPQCGGRSANPRTPCPADVDAMVAALPATAPARPKSPRKVLVIARAAGYAHSSIPLAARTVEELGKKTGAWSTTITYDAADVTEQNLKSYDAIFLASTTGHFLDDPNDAAATAARRKALLDFVRGGKGLARHPCRVGLVPRQRQGTAVGRIGPGRPYASRLASLGPGIDAAVPVGTRMVADGDANGDKMLSREEIDGGRRGVVRQGGHAEDRARHAGRLRQGATTRSCRRVHRPRRARRASATARPRPPNSDPTTRSARGPSSTRCSAASSSSTGTTGSRSPTRSTIPPAR